MTNINVEKSGTGFTGHQFGFNLPPEQYAKLRTAIENFSKANPFIRIMPKVEGQAKRYEWERAEGVTDLEARAAFAKLAAELKPLGVTLSPPEESLEEIVKRLEAEHFFVTIGHTTNYRRIDDGDVYMVTISTQKRNDKRQLITDKSHTEYGSELKKTLRLADRMFRVKLAED